MVFEEREMNEETFWVVMNDLKVGWGWWRKCRRGELLSYREGKKMLINGSNLYHQTTEYHIVLHTIIKKRCLQQSVTNS